MNAKGIIFSFMVLALVLGVIILNNYIEASRNDAEQHGNIILLEKLNEKISNVFNNIGNLPKEGKAKQSFERIIPFNYSFDGNYLDLNFTLPFEQSKINNFYDAINLYRIFVEDTNYSNLFDGANVSLETLKNAAWNGSSKNLQFVVIPNCLGIKNIDLNQIMFEDSNNQMCQQSFSMADVKRIDFNISLFDVDFNAIKCNGAACPQDPYVQGSPNPYVKIYLETTNCPSCILAQKTISRHFNPAVDFNFFLYCNGPNCKSKSITVIAGQKLYEISSNNTINSVKFAFNKPVEGMFFSDFNVIASTDKNISISKAKASNMPFLD